MINTVSQKFALQKKSTQIVNIQQNACIPPAS